VEYIVTLTTHLTFKLNQILPDAYHLSSTEQTNKLAVCLGDGSYYDKHIDNLGGTEHEGDRRKLTALLYLQPPGSHDGQPSFPNESVEDDDRGGYFRAYDVPEVGDVTCIAPRGDRLIMFWSDSLVHDVSPSYAPNGDSDKRWALTIWFIADKEKGIIKPTDATIEKRHFSNGIGKG
jgi:Rps23 Pro-64 3,4-dihydroxylase Tpa1-like proline 4-hydroxylase